METAVRRGERVTPERGRELARSAPEIERWLIAYLSAEYGLSEDAIAGARAFPDLGLDSVEAVSMAAALEEWLGWKLCESVWDDFAGVAALSLRVAGAERVNGGAAALRAPVDGGPTSLSAHPFMRCMNPHLGRRLEKLNLAKRFVRGRGCYVYDTEGRRYLDFLAGYGALPFGHNPRAIWRAVEAVRESGEPTFVQPSYLEAAGRLAERLIATGPPGLRYVAFANSGAEAVEAAIKLCRASTGRRGVLSCRYGFHGKTLGALSATDNPKYQRAFGAPVAEFDSIPFGDVGALEAVLRKRPGYYAALLIEPIQGEGGIVEPPPGYLLQVEHACHAAGTLVVADEVQTGLGRTGSLFASSAAGLHPDVLTLAKALGGGLVPVGACLYAESAASEEFGLHHSSTFAGNSLACRVGLAVLDLLERNDGELVRRVGRIGARLKRGLEALKSRYPEVLAEVRGQGFLLGIRLGIDRQRWPDSLLGVAAEQGLLAAMVSSYLLNVHRVRVAPTLNGADVIRVEPPLTASWRHCREFLTALDQTLDALSSRDTGCIVESIITESKRPSPRSSRLKKVRQADEARPGDGRFAFLLHPLTISDYVRFDATLGHLDADTLQDAMQRLSDLVDPFVVHSVRIVSPTSSSAFGDFILVPRVTEDLLKLPRSEAVREVAKALELAKERGATLVGLGAYTSIVTGGGRSLAERDVALTSGNAYTVVAGIEGIERALAALGRTPAGATAAVVGATGSIGRLTAILLAERVGRLVLVGNPARPALQARSVLLRAAADAVQHLAREAARGRQFESGSLGSLVASRGQEKLADGDVAACLPLLSEIEKPHDGIVLCQDINAALRLAEIVIVATSSPKALIAATWLRSGAVVCDLSRPRNVSASVPAERPDVLVIDGGIVQTPGGVDVGPFGLPKGTAYACMGETMILALEGSHPAPGPGREPDVDSVLRLRGLALKHGFQLDELRSFGRALSALDFERVRRALGGSAPSKEGAAGGMQMSRRRV